MKVSLFKTIMEITLAVSLLMIGIKIPFFESIFSQVSLVVGLFTLILGAKTICQLLRRLLLLLTSKIGKQYSQKQSLP